MCVHNNNKKKNESVGYFSAAAVCVDGFVPTEFLFLPCVPCAKWVGIITFGFWNGGVLLLLLLFLAGLYPSSSTRCPSETIIYKKRALISTVNKYIYISIYAYTRKTWLSLAGPHVDRLWYTHKKGDVNDDESLFLNVSLCVCCCCSWWASRASPAHKTVYVTAVEIISPAAFLLLPSLI